MFDSGLYFIYSIILLFYRLKKKSFYHEDSLFFFKKILVLVIEFHLKGLTLPTSLANVNSLDSNYSSYITTNPINTWTFQFLNT